MVPGAPLFSTQHNCMGFYGKYIMGEICSTQLVVQMVYESYLTTGSVSTISTVVIVQI